MEIIKEDLYEPRARYLGRKGIYPYILDYDDAFRRLNITPLLANDIDLSKAEGRERFNQIVYSSYEGDVFSNVPHCPCHHLRGGDRIGDTCPKCGFQCLPTTEQTIEPIVWIRCPDELPGFLNLSIYEILRPKFLRSGFSTLDWLIDPSYRPPRLDCPQEILLKELGIGRGLTNFHNHFDEIMETICLTRRSFSTGKGRVMVDFARGGEGKKILKFIRKRRHLMFCRHLPFPSKIGFIIESTQSRKYVDPTMGPAVDALLSLAKSAQAIRSSKTALESRVARALNKLTQYYQMMRRDKLFDKKGIMRKLVFGVSPHFSFRTVITSNHKVHDYESLELPWGAAVMTFKLHIANKLLKRGYTPNEIFNLIYDNVLKTHPVLERIFDELIAESPNGRGIPCVFTRYPSLKRGSSQRFFIDKIKRDVTDLSTSISVHCLRAENADFDGDYMSGQLALDNEMAEAYERLAPHTGLMDLRRPYQVSDHAMTPAPVLSTINRRLEFCDDHAVVVEV